jgi:hypothetical protein
MSPGEPDRLQRGTASKPINLKRTSPGLVFASGSEPQSAVDEEETTNLYMK